MEAQQQSARRETGRNNTDRHDSVPRVDIRATARAALSAVDAILARWLPEGKRQGPEWVARNPNRDDGKPGSFSVNSATGAWSDFATGDKGGDLVSLVRYLDGLPTQGDAARRLADWLGIAPTEPRHCNGPDRPKAAPAPEPHPTLSPIPPEAMASRPQAHRTHGKPVAEWRYCDAQGRPLCFVLRFDPPEARKQFAPLTWDGSRWQWKAPPEPRPLYGLDRLAARPGAPVLLCEGEKAADAAAALLPECVTVTTMNGAQSPKKADWTPIRGRRVRIWPDHDDPGAQYARTAAALAYGAGAESVATLDLAALADELPRGWDAADALADGWTAERIGERARWVEFPDPYSKSEGTEGTQGTALNSKAFSGSPGENPRGTEGTAKTKPPVKRPCFEVHDRQTGYGPSGLYWHGVNKDGEDLDQWICSPLHADAMTCSERDTEHGLLLRFRNAGGRWREWSMPMELLKGSGEELRGELLALGVRIDPASHRLLNAYLMSRYPKRRVLAATSTGWHTGTEGGVFVLPNRIIGTGDVRFQSEHAQHDEFATAGTLDGWQREIAARCVGNPMLVLAVSAALAGPLLTKVHRTGGGFHLVGDSSTGKSTALACGASVWGGPGFVRTWRATANGLEGIAAALNDTALILDEISEADPRELGAVIYAIGNGTGKSRASRTGGARAVRRWRVMLLSSGERTLSATMTEGGKRAKAGQEARLMDIPCARRFGLFDELHGLPNGRALSDTLRTAAAAHHGHAGPALVERLVSDPGDVGELLADIQARPEFAAETSLEGRAAGAFALAALAGELATAYGITGWPEGEALTAAATAYQAWKTHRGKGHTETRQILEAIDDFVSSHGDARFSHVLSGDGPLIRDRAGWYRDGEETRVYLFTRAGLREAAAGFDFRRVLDALDAEGWIAERDKDKRSKATKVQGRTEHLYAIAPRDIE
jgi:putative DNA primase/helicase